MKHSAATQHASSVLHLSSRSWNVVVFKSNGAAFRVATLALRSITQPTYLLIVISQRCSVSCVVFLIMCGYGLPMFARHRRSGSFSWRQGVVSTLSRLVLVRQFTELAFKLVVSSYVRYSCACGRYRQDPNNLLSEKNIRAYPAKPWQPRTMPATYKWLQDALTSREREQLTSMDNIVAPETANFAANLLCRA